MRMLTRDIELQDALLDLLDNCIDGIIRTGSSGSDVARPYHSFSAKLTLAADRFIIEDNCGGIPKDHAEKYAFSMGRPLAIDGASHGATVGMYGIGMKRAIFKLGTEAHVESHNDTGFLVKFTEAWMSDNEWNDLPMHKLVDGDLQQGCTRITVTKLNDEARSSFENNEWIDDFKRTVSRHYSLIIAKGFSVIVRSPTEIDKHIDPISAEEFKLIETHAAQGETKRIAPYIYAGKIGEVDIEIFAGLYRQLLSEEQAEDEENTTGVSDDAGWTVACNDRVVIWKDKTRLTGWGEATVPNYHGQFIAITGIVLLRCDDPRKLPLTTTKRGIDAASDVYSASKDLMRDATKQLTSFTNKWKKFPQKLEEIYKASGYLDLSKLRSLPREESISSEMVKVHRSPDIRKFAPDYPEPEQAKTSTRVSFVALTSDVKILAKHFFDDESAKPGEVGEHAFMTTLKIAKQEQN